MKIIIVKKTNKGKFFAERGEYKSDEWSTPAEAVFDLLEDWGNEIGIGIDHEWLRNSFDKNNKK